MIRRILVLAIVALVPVALFTIPSSGDAPHPVGASDTLRLSGMPGTTPSSSFLIYVSNSTQSLSILATSSTALQDSAGHQIASSSVNLTPTLSTIDANRFTTLIVTIFVPLGTTPGNYSGHVVLLAANGSTTTLSLDLTVQPPYYAYLIIIALIVIGVTLSFAYSPWQDKDAPTKPDEPGRPDAPNLDDLIKRAQTLAPPDHQAQLIAEGEARLNFRQVQAEYVQAQQVYLAAQKQYLNDMSRYKWTGTGEGKNKNHAFVYLTAAILSLVAFAYFFESATDFWAQPLRDSATAFLQGFFIHRGIDGLAPKIFK